MKCPHCGSSRVRLSKFRAVDIERLFFFQYPVRCHACYEREYVGLFAALKLRVAGDRNNQERRARRKEGK
jgi:hypothetical protein